jgi:aspartyl-tRNA(Asn)/glutamyl-tRNA(Gln) amidotransferase subunit B
MEIEMVVGLEIHVQLSTKTKMFCRCKNDSFNSRPNENICPVCMGFPGQLPVLNKCAVDFAIKAALALNCKINQNNKMDRKNYFYPDNPRGFQISQYDRPLSENGFVELGGDFSENKVRVKRVHIEDDAGKLTHFDGFSLVDFNRAGCPLIEIVSEPDISSAKQASAYAKEVQKILRFVGVSDADMEKGQLRFDASVSVREKGDKNLNHRAEIKNLNSFKSLELAIEFEYEKQKALFLKGEKLSGDLTLGFNDIEKNTYFLRDKEESLDYRYFPEPDIPVLTLSDELIMQIKNFIPILPAEKKKQYVEIGMGEEEAEFVSSNPKFSAYFDKLLEITRDVKLSTTFFNSVLVQYLKEFSAEIEAQKVTPEILSELILLVKDGKLSVSSAKADIFPVLFETGESPLKILEEKGLMQISDTSFIEDVCKKIVSENPESVDSIKNGKDRVLGFLIGLVMKESKGKANPKLVDETIRKIISQS